MYAPVQTSRAEHDGRRSEPGPGRDADRGVQQRRRNAAPSACSDCTLRLQRFCTTPTSEPVVIDGSAVRAVATGSTFVAGRSELACRSCSSESDYGDADRATQNRFGESEACASLISFDELAHTPHISRRIPCRFASYSVRLVFEHARLHLEAYRLAQRLCRRRTAVAVHRHAAKKTIHLFGSSLAGRGCGATPIDR